MSPMKISSCALGNQIMINQLAFKNNFDFSDDYLTFILRFYVSILNELNLKVI